MAKPKDLTDLVGENEGRWNALRPLDDMLRNRFRSPYLPARNRSQLAVEYNELITRTGLNILPTIANTLVNRLRVIGMRTEAEGQPDEEIWRWWQASRLDQRQVLVLRDAAQFGDGFVLVTPGGDTPQFTPQSPLALAVEYDPFDPYRVKAAGKIIGRDGWFYDSEAIWHFQRQSSGLDWRLAEAVEHAAGECPVVRFPNNFDSLGRSQSEIEPVVAIQNRIHQTVMDRLLLQRHQAWRQRWASGIAVEVDEDGNPIPPFNDGVDTVLISEEESARFGEFAQANIDGLLKAVNEDIQSAAMVSQIPPHYLPVTSISNISSDTLVALEASLNARVGERKLLWGESFEQMVKMGGAMVGVAVSDNAETLWADLELQSEAQKADAAVKLSSIGLPLHYLMERLGLTPQTIKRVMAYKTEQEAAEAMAQAQAYGVGLVPDATA